MNEGLYVMDACGLIAFLRQEKGEEEVSRLLEKSAAAEVRLYLHKITLMEVVYDNMRTGPQNDSHSFISSIYRLPLIITDMITDDFILQAARYKASFKISFADSFVLALAKTLDGVVVTSDHHEFDSLEGQGEIKFKWIR